MKALGAILALACLAAGGADARGAGDNILIVAVTNVRVPQALPGACRVSGLVREVRQGSGFRPGQSVFIDVPCGAGTPILDSRPLTAEPGPSMPVDAAVLSRSTLGFARVDDAGELVWRPVEHVEGGLSGVWGYRVLEGAVLPLERRPS